MFALTMGILSGAPTGDEKVAMRRWERAWMRVAGGVGVGQVAPIHRHPGLVPGSTVLRAMPLAAATPTQPQDHA